VLVLLGPRARPAASGDDDDFERPLTLLERLQLYAWGVIRPEGRML
jgi:hypothetical protein